MSNGNQNRSERDLSGAEHDWLIQILSHLGEVQHRQMDYIAFVRLLGEDVRLVFECQLHPNSPLPGHIPANCGRRPQLTHVPHSLTPDEQDWLTQVRRCLIDVLESRESFLWVLEILGHDLSLMQEYDWKMGAAYADACVPKACR
ncbi:MAG: hypothetical protein WD049_07420 [Candidatus Paceibacterota bacterium]